MLMLGSKRFVNCYDGKGGDDWIPATLINFEEKDKTQYAVFSLDRPAHDGRMMATIPLPSGSHRLRSE